MFAGREIECAPLAEDGEGFRLGPVPPGRYELRLVPDGNVIAPPELASVSIELQAGRCLEVEIPLPASDIVSVPFRLLDARNGRAIHASPITILVGGRIGDLLAFPDEDGLLRVSAYAGSTYTLRLQVPGYRDLQLEIDVSAEARPLEYLVELEPCPPFHLTVLDRHSRPISNRFLELYPTCSGHLDWVRCPSTRTGLPKPLLLQRADSAGHLALSTLAAGEYLVRRARSGSVDEDAQEIEGTCTSVRLTDRERPYVIGLGE